MRHDGMRFVLAVVLAVSAAHPALAGKYSLLTYNTGLLRVAGWSLVPAVAARSRVAARELSAFVAENRPDIILLQEVWKNSTASAISRELAPLGYTAVRPLGCNPVCLGSGLLLLVHSPLRVVRWKFTPFTKRPGIEVVTRKGVLQAVIEDPAAGGMQFALVGAHTAALDTIGGQPKDKGQLDAFRDQTRQILEALEAASANGSLPVALLGDFNVGPGYADEAYNAIARLPGMVEAGAELFPGEAFVTWDPLNPLVRLGRYPNEPAAKIDHVFLRGGGSLSWMVTGVRVVLGSPVEGLSVRDPVAGAAVAVPLSDHYGFLAEVELTGR